MQGVKTLRYVEPFTNDPKNKKRKFCATCANIATQSPVLMWARQQSQKDIVILVLRILDNLQILETLAGNECKRNPMDEEKLTKTFAKRTIEGIQFVMTCKGICRRHKAIKPIGRRRYAAGLKRCQVCNIFIKWEGFFCPCCGCRLRTKPRNQKYKLILAQIQSKKT